MQIARGAWGFVLSRGGCHGLEREAGDRSGQLPCIRARLPDSGLRGTSVGAAPRPLLTYCTRSRALEEESEEVTGHVPIEKEAGPSWDKQTERDMEAHVSALLAVEEQESGVRGAAGVARGIESGVSWQGRPLGEGTVWTRGHGDGARGAF